MIASKKATHAPNDVLPASLPTIALHHGEALWVLAQLGFQGRASASTFYEYIKSLRKLGTPFERGERGYATRSLANYTYCHLMELALVLTLRVYHCVPDSILIEIVRHRASLYRHFVQAYTERCAGAGAPLVVQTSSHKPIVMRGVFLDLKIDFSGGKLVKLGPPRLLSPFEALSVFTLQDTATRAPLPLNLSLLAERLVATMLRAPIIRRGPRPGRRHHRAERSHLGADAHEAERS